MLTKQERAAIAERIKSIGYVDEKTFYESIVGKCIPSTTSYSEDLKTIFRVVLDLCDTSNMIELPVDKDGEVIHTGDVVYTSDGEEHKMAGYIMRKNTTEIILSVNSEGTYITTSANKLTHKKPETIASLVSKIRHLLTTEDISDELSDKIWELTDLVEISGDNND